MENKIFYLMLAAIGTIGGHASLPIAEATQVQIVERQAHQQKDLTEACDRARAHLESLAHHDAAVMQQYRDFEASLISAVASRSMTSSDVELVLSGLIFAADKHKSQKRKNTQIPYIVHPIGVASSIIKIGKIYDPNVLVAALLHDTVEDTDTTFEEISTRFGEKVASVVKEVSDDTSLTGKARKKMQIIHAFHKSKEAATIKLSDKLYNLNNLLRDAPSDWSRERIDQYFQWAQAVIDNLPNSNEPLKQEVHRVIKEYWAQQSK